MNSTDSIVEICHILIQRRKRFLSLYRPYCQKKQQSEAIRNELFDGNKFFNECQHNAGHLLPLNSYLLKPIQRITKYQLLLKELLRYSPDECRHDVKAALASMLDLLSQLNADLKPKLKLKLKNSFFIFLFLLFLLLVVFIWIHLLFYCEFVIQCYYRNKDFTNQF